MSNDPNKNIIETERLTLRPIQQIDFEDVYALDSDPEVRHFFPEGPLNAEQVQKELERHIAEWEKVGVGIFAVIEKKTNQFIGRCGFAQLPNGVTEFGYLIKKELWGQGYATEAAIALLEWGAKHIPADRIIGFAPLNHVASIRILEKIGMKFWKMDIYQNIPCVFYQYEFRR